MIDKIAAEKTAQGVSKKYIDPFKFDCSEEILSLVSSSHVQSRT